MRNGRAGPALLVYLTGFIILFFFTKYKDVLRLIKRHLGEALR